MVRIRSVSLFPFVQCECKCNSSPAIWGRRMGKYENGTLTLRMNDILKCVLSCCSKAHNLYGTRSTNASLKNVKNHVMQRMQYIAKLVRFRQYACLAAFGVAGNCVEVFKWFCFPLWSILQNHFNSTWALNGPNRCTREFVCFFYLLRVWGAGCWHAPTCPWPLKSHKHDPKLASNSAKQRLKLYPCSKSLSNEVQQNGFNKERKQGMACCLPRVCTECVDQSPGAKSSTIFWLMSWKMPGMLSQTVKKHPTPSSTP